MASKEREILTTKEAADFLNLSTFTVRKLAASGRLPSVKIGSRTLRFSKTALSQWAQGGGEK